MWRGLLNGAAAGAAGTTALNAVTYLDMAYRGRAASRTPEQSVDVIAGRFGVTVPGEGEQRDNRRSGLGALSGIATGVGIGAAVGLLRVLGVRVPPLLVGAAAMAATGASMTGMGVSDPRTWSGSDWLADAVPHAAYGLVTGAVLDALQRRR